MVGLESVKKNKQKIFSPIYLANQEIKNRIFMAPMGTGLEEYYPGGRVSTEMVDYYEERAKGGVGLVISPFAAVDERYFALTLGIYSRNLLPGISRLAEVLHAYDCKFLVQLSHFGGKSPKYFVHGRNPIAPSSIKSRMYPDMPEEMSVEQIEEIIRLFIQSGVWAKEAGCDGVELHGAHGYLINQFLSPHSNLRDDEYGGSSEKRMLFLEKISRGIRKRCGEDFIIGLKLSAHEHLEGGIDIEIAKDISKKIDDNNIADYIHVSAFSTTLPGYLECDYPSVPPIYNRQPLVPLAEKIKKEVNIPVGAAGGISDPDYSESLLKNKKVDFLVLGRALIANPNWAEDVRTDKKVKECIKCNTCYKRILNQQYIKCAINPLVGEEKRFSVYLKKKASETKKVVIIGGGPAGMEAAIQATDRGHEVVLFEKKELLGGNLRLAAIQDFKIEVKKLLEYYISNISERKIDIRLKNLPSSKDILNEKPDSIIVATGSIPVVPGSLDIKDNKILLATELLEKIEDLNIGKKIAIIGAGLVGCEVALFLSTSFNKDVTLLDCVDFNSLLTDEAPINKSMLFYSLKKAGVKLLCEKEISGIDDRRLVLSGEDNDDKGKIIFDDIIVASGFRPDDFINKISDEIASYGEKVGVFNIGDSKKVGKFYDAINKGAQVAWRI